MYEPFFAFRRPGCSDIIAFSGEVRVLTEIPDELPSGFLIHPFDTSLPTLYITPDRILESIPEYVAESKPVFFPKHDTVREDHACGVKGIVSELNELYSERGIAGKAVLSRVKIESGEFSPCKLFDILCRRNINAFVFCYYTPATGMWIGASPEVLLKGNTQSVATMSLAGTRPADTGAEWDMKNIEEQQIVTDFIVSEIERFGGTPSVSAVYTRKAGNVEHLCTDIIADGKINSSLAFYLSPTPALSGYPRKFALSAIRRYELHDRGYYGGFCGYVAENKDFEFYVNLRSGCYIPARRALYAGGGITRFSNPEDEWEETNRKFLISKIENFLSN